MVSPPGVERWLIINIDTTEIMNYKTRPIPKYFYFETVSLSITNITLDCESTTDNTNTFSSIRTIEEMKFNVVHENQMEMLSSSVLN